MLREKKEKEIVKNKDVKYRRNILSRKDVVKEK